MEMVEVFDNLLSEENFPDRVNELALVPFAVRLKFAWLEKTRKLPATMLTFSTAVVRRGWVPVHATVPRRA